MKLKSTEKNVTLYFSVSTPNRDVRRIEHELNSSGFVVKKEKAAYIVEPYIATAVGSFSGERSITGFISGHNKLFKVAYEKAKKLAG